MGPIYIHKLPINRPSGRYVNPYIGVLGGMGYRGEVGILGLGSVCDADIKAPIFIKPAGAVDREFVNIYWAQLGPNFIQLGSNWIQIV